MALLRGGWSVVALTLLALASLRADEVYLTDGRVLDGVVVSQPGEDVVRVKRGSGSLVVTQHFPARDVDHIVYGKSDRQRKLEAIASERAKLGDGGDAGEWWDLAVRARDLGDTGLARELAQQVVLRDRQHQPARRMLGMVQVKGVWMRPNESAAAQGLTLENGRWVTWTEHEEILAAEAKQREQAIARRKAAEELRNHQGGDQLPYGTIDVPGYSTPTYETPYYPLVPRIVTWPTSNFGPTVISGSALGGATVVGPGTTVVGGSGLIINGGGHGGNTGWCFHWGG